MGKFIFFTQYFFRPVFGCFCPKSAAVRPPNFPGHSEFILQNFLPAGNSAEISTALQNSGRKNWYSWELMLGSTRYCHLAGPIYTWSGQATKLKRGARWPAFITATFIVIIFKKATAR
jgi:hypothetical protein